MGKNCFRYFILLSCFLLLVGSTAFAASGKRLSDVERITVEQLQQLQAREPVVIIDTRAPGQWIRATGKIPGAIRLATRDDLLTLRDKAGPDTAIVTYCT